MPLETPVVSCNSKWYSEGEMIGLYKNDNQAAIPARRIRYKHRIDNTNKDCLADALKLEG